MIRRRLLGIVLVSLICGIVLQYLFSLSLIIIVFIFIFNIIMLALKKNNNNYVLYILASLLVCFGCLIAQLELDNDGQINRLTVNNKVRVYGNIIQKDVEEYREYYFKAKRVFYKNESFKVNEKLLLRVSDNLSNKDMKNKRVVLQGIVEKPPGARNPRLFNYKLYLKNRGIYGIINSKNNDIEILGELEFPNKHYIRSYFKNYFYKYTQEIIKGKEGTLAFSIVFGDKSTLEENVYESFKISGVAHILAVSGLHFGILFLFVNSILRIFKIKSSYIAVISIIIIWCFAFLSGYPISGVRAASMITIYVLSQFFDRKYDLFSALFFIGIVTIITKPLIILDIGFQLSFIAVISIGILYGFIFDKLKFIPNYLKKIISASLAAQIGIAPLIAYHFNIFTPWALFFNIPIIILTGYILPLTLLISTLIPISTKITKVLAVIDKYLIRIIIFISSLSKYFPYSGIKVISPKIYFIILYYCLILLLIYKNKIKALYGISKKKIIMIILSIYMVINILIYVYPKELKVTFIDVGQGDCALIETPNNKKILIDGGNFKKNNLLTQFLLKNHIKKVDLIFLSHIHNDHLGGLVNIIDDIKMNRIIIGTDEYDTLEWLNFMGRCEEKRIPITKIYKGNSLKIENDLNIEILGPPKDLIKGYGDEINNNSLVVLLKYKELDVLFTGDIENKAETLLLLDNTIKDIDILKVAHHGSNEATSLQFLKKLKPEIAVIQVGKNNYGHPSEKVIDRLFNEKIEIYRNDKDGAVIIESNGYETKIFKTIDHLE